MVGEYVKNVGETEDTCTVHINLCETQTVNESAIVASSDLTVSMNIEAGNLEIMDRLAAPEKSATGFDLLHGWYAVLLAAAISVFAVGVIFTLHVIGEIPVGDLTRDTAIVTHGHPWHGLLSQIGMFFWAGAATMCLLLWTSATRLGCEQRIANFGLFSGLLTIWLALDDTLMLHDIVFPDMVGFPENAVYGTHILLVLAYLFFSRKVILRTDTKLLTLAFVLFAASLAVDTRIVPVGSEDLLYLLEDGAKFGGIVSWFGYFFVNTRSIVLPNGQA